MDWPVPDQPVERSAADAAALAPYRALIDEVSAVFGRLAFGSKTSAGYDDSKVAELLTDKR